MDHGPFLDEDAGMIVIHLASTTQRARDLPATRVLLDARDEGMATHYLASVRRQGLHGAWMACRRPPNVPRAVAALATR